MSKAYIRQLKEATEKLSKWESSGKIFGHIEKLSKKKTDRLYEFFCYIKVVYDLRKNYQIVFEPGTKAGLFPLNPGGDNEWAKFLLIERNRKIPKFKICLGTEIVISSAPDTTVAPDISIQKAKTPSTPTEKDILMIFDAKYKYSASKTLDIGILREFAKCVDDLEVKDAASYRITFSDNRLKGNCLLTNGSGIDKHRQYCINNKIKQVHGFDCGKKEPLVIG